VLAQLLVALAPPAFPVALGVLYCNPAQSYEQAVYAQPVGAPGNLDALLRKGRTWSV